MVKQQDFRCRFRLSAWFTRHELPKGANDEVIIISPKSQQVFERENRFIENQCRGDHRLGETLMLHKVSSQVLNVFEF